MFSKAKPINTPIQSAVILATDGHSEVGVAAVELSANCLTLVSLLYDCDKSSHSNIIKLTTNINEHVSIVLQKYCKNMRNSILIIVH